MAVVTFKNVADISDKAPAAAPAPAPVVENPCKVYHLPGYVITFCPAPVAPVAPVTKS